MKWAAVAPIWTRIGVPCIVFREESEYGTPGAQFATKTTKNNKICFNACFYLEKKTILTGL